MGEGLGDKRLRAPGTVNASRVTNSLSIVRTRWYFQRCHGPSVTISPFSKSAERGMPRYLS